MRSPSFPLAAAATSLVVAAIALPPRPAAAQNRQQPVVVRGVAATPEGARAGAAFARAQRLVAEGQGAAGRAVVDSTIAATDSTSPVFAEGLFWRASLAATAADAERDYRTLAVEYPLSPRSADALLRLAQLELARGDRLLAVKHLERLTLEHPTSPARPRASYWMARVLFESGDVSHACSALDAARAGAAPNEMALRTQIDEYAPRCKGGAALARAKAAPATPATTSGDTATGAVAAAPVVPNAASPADAAGTSTHSAAGSRVVPRDTISVFAAAALPGASASAPAPTTRVTAAPAPTPTSSASAAPAPASPPIAPLPNANGAASGKAAAAEVKTPLATAAPVVRAASPARPATTAPSTPRSATREVYAVQLAAFDAAAPAEALVARLRGRGLDARVSGAAAPFRVRVGRYATSGAAEKAAASFKSRGQPAWVVTESVPAAGAASAAGAPPGATR